MYENIYGGNIRMEEIRKNLFYEQKNGYDLIDTEERVALESYCRDYMAYLNASRTEREAVANAIAEAEEQGFVEYEYGMELKAGMNYKVSFYAKTPEYAGDIRVIIEKSRDIYAEKIFTVEKYQL